MWKFIQSSINGLHTENMGGRTSKGTAGNFSHRFMGFEHQVAFSLANDDIFPWIKRKFKIFVFFGFLSIIQHSRFFACNQRVLLIFFISNFAVSFVHRVSNQLFGGKQKVIL